MIIYQDRLGTNVQKTQKGRLSSVFRPHGNISASWACAANTASATGVSYNVSVPVGVSAKQPFWHDFLVQTECFAKTGSGQTWEKWTKRQTGFCR
jgi:hypothetical protein